MRRRNLILGSILVWAATTACTPAAPPTQACTLIGCVDGLNVLVENAPPSSTIELVLPDGSTRSSQCDGGGGCAEGVFFEGVSAEQATVRITANGRTSEYPIRAEYRSAQPNGPGCPPTCRQGLARVTFAG